MGLRRSASFCVLASLLIGLAVACGGQSFSPGGAATGEAGRAGNLGTAGASSAGSSNAHGGQPPVGNAGATFGGTTTAGYGGISSAGARGEVPTAACSGPPVYGPALCDAYFPRWTHDPTTGLCRPYIYGGCGAAENLYDTLEACQMACPGGDPNFDECQVARDCTLDSTGCCGVCDSDQVSAQSFIAYNRKYAAKVRTCGDVACGACPPPPVVGTLKNFFANCVHGECVVQDLRTLAETACTKSSECRVRRGTDCCPGCNSEATVAVRADGSFERLVCGDADVACDACASEPLAVPVCGDDGHCQAASLMPGGNP